MDFSYCAEYAKTGRSKCRGCKSAIGQGTLRLAAMVQASTFDGKTSNWYDYECFFRKQRPKSVDDIQHFEDLRLEDQTKIKDKIGSGGAAVILPDTKVKGKKRDATAVAAKKAALEDFKIEKAKDRRTMCKGCEQKILKDEVKISKKDFETEVSLKYGAQDMWHHLSCFANLRSELGYFESAEALPGFELLDEADQAEAKKELPPIKQEDVPEKKLKSEHFFLRPKVARQVPALYNMEFVILGQHKRSKEELKKQIANLGGKVTTKISGTVMAVFASEADVEKMGRRMQTVQANQVHVVPKEFVDEAPQHVGKIPELVVAKSICDWGSDPKTRLLPERSTSKSGSSSMPSKVKLTNKGGTAVDPDSGLEHEAHVYTYNSEKYTAVLSKTDIQSKKNSYYKLQLLQSDREQKFWVFRSWGCIGTTIGGNKLKNFHSLHDAKTAFCQLYEQKTGNKWEDHHNFQKVPGLYNPVDVDYGDDEQAKSLDVIDSTSFLPVPVQNLMSLIFDVNAMQKVMLEFELDTEKMPLGKLSKKQIQNAYSVLTELQQLVDNNGAENRIIDATNRFYTFIPHSFGTNDPPVLRDTEVIKQKIDMLDSLLEFEIAYNLMKSSGSEKNVDGYYKQLNTEIEVLDKEAEEFSLIQDYVKNTHADIQSSYTLEIKDVFTVKRQGEDERFKPFEKLHNHKLLWYGSRTTNFAGILAQGLRIAPPGAPVTGYMFGKGIYFADMVSKSANYCCTGPTNPTGLLLLCDVALGNMYERTQAEYVEKLPNGKHSTKALGRTEPDPSAAKSLNGIEVPLGKGVTANNRGSALLYNEYIVYDVAQVNVKYLLKVDFKYKD